MKKKKTNIVHLNKKKKKSSGRLEKRRQDDRIKKAVHDFFYAYDPNPPIGEVRSSEVYNNFLFHSLIDCSKKKFGELARKYVIAIKGKDRQIYYILRDEVIVHLLSVRDDYQEGGTIVTKAA